MENRDGPFRREERPEEWIAVRSRRLVLVATFVIGLTAGAAAGADCCQIVKVDAETPPVQVRVCEPDASGACGSVLLLGTFELGEGETVCPSGDTLVYQEYDDALGDFAPPIAAVCVGDVEL